MMIGMSRGPLAGAELAANVEAVHAGKHDVEQDRVGQHRLGLAQPFLTVVGDVGLVTLAVEVPGEGLGQSPLVLNDQDARLGHRNTPRRRRASVGGERGSGHGTPG